MNRKRLCRNGLANSPYHGHGGVGERCQGLAVNERSDGAHQTYLGHVLHAMSPKQGRACVVLAVRPHQHAQVVGYRIRAQAGTASSPMIHTSSVGWSPRAQEQRAGAGDDGIGLRHHASASRNRRPRGRGGLDP